MAWLEQRGDKFRIAFRFRGEKFRVNLKATEPKEADGCLARLEENLRLVERGRLDVPPGADLGLFLISDGKLEKPVELVRAVRLSEQAGFSAVNVGGGYKTYKLFQPTA
jgi:hypothetical protein